MSRTTGAWLLLLLTGALLDLAPTTRAASGPPDQMTYQGYLVDNNQKPLGTPAPANYPVVFRIYDDSENGNRLWAEQQVVTVDNGNFSVILGEGSPVTGEANTTSLSGVFTGTSADRRFLGLTVTLGGQPVVIQPRLRLLPAPYSFLASQALTAGSVDGGGITAGTVADARLSSNVALRGGGNTFTGKQTVSAPINVNGANVIEFGADTAGKQSDAGKIGYQAFSDGLDITGAGTTGSNRKVKVWAEAGASFTGPVAATSFAGDGTIPVGGIIMWSGSIANIPSGWALCNGQTVNGNATPDLRDRFLVGAGASYPVGNTGGAAQVTLTEAQMPSHIHSYKDGYFVEAFAGIFDPNSGAYKLLPGGGVDDYPTAHITGSSSNDADNNRIYWRGMNTNPTGGNQAQENRPPWYALAYIMRVR